MKVTIEETELTRKELDLILDKLDSLIPSVSEVLLSISLLTLERRPYDSEAYDEQYGLEKLAVIEQLPILDEAMYVLDSRTLK